MQGDDPAREVAPRDLAPAGLGDELSQTLLIRPGPDRLGQVDVGVGVIVDVGVGVSVGVDVGTGVTSVLAQPIALTVTSTTTSINTSNIHSFFMMFPLSKSFVLA